ncbi:unnamed protein product [Owenia fusiformis]|uniref:Uncharacterized protein n=1 Tax=Owenia fusiformis TaxID=6347 RepID=A0A8J1U7S7_OWEFU|nr:unnamed protein product [Owenia fusiformis]
MRQSLHLMLFLCSFVFVRGKPKTCTTKHLDGLEAVLKDYIDNKLNDKFAALKHYFDLKIDSLKSHFDEKVDSMKIDSDVQHDLLKKQLSETRNALSECACEKQRQRGLVYHMEGSRGRYSLTCDEAKALCESRGHKLATKAQLLAAYELGLQMCRTGWLEGCEASYPIQMPRSACGRRGINDFISSSGKADVFCAVD